MRVGDLVWCLSFDNMFNKREVTSRRLALIRDIEPNEEYPSMTKYHIYICNTGTCGYTNPKYIEKIVCK